MKMVGHRTEAFYRRYAIAEEGMLREAGAKLDRFRAAAVSDSPQRDPVVPSGGRSVSEVPERLVD
jgi:hypothetical protein